ncbi:heme oxygenase-like protein [Westerdykella ornata]|uniref:Heme oxygenase-like protein n=1 Tax=Westerdykella ornata TaxID=318751 RepID=A0A6A6JS56_WESOR|nr:heme oxygenase-like protein [Westerdykella ornata]KAF2278698.1 heme oxygenase-like protein [Westerdykella ornata]
MADKKTATCISDEINVATRTSHNVLNHIITTHLPLALPPYAADPTLYATGISHVSHIFLTFESLWADLEKPGVLSKTSPPSPEMLGFLTSLRPPGMARAGRIKRDLGFLTGKTEAERDATLNVHPENNIATYCAHIRETVREKPHCLISYAWCYYMAVFAGGRWIRSQLVNAGEDFWRNPSQGRSKNGIIGDEKEDDGLPLEERGLALWNFDGVEDGEDIKADFKRRLALGEVLFTEQQRRDIVQEAKEVFLWVERVVEDIDKEVGTNMEMLDRQARKMKGGGRPGQGHGAVAAEKQQHHQNSAWWMRRPDLLVALACMLCVALVKLLSRFGSEGDVVIA